MGRGGSRWGAGRKPRKIKAETLPSISVTALRKSGLFEEPCMVYFQMRGLGVESGTLEISEVDRDDLQMGWKFRRNSSTIEGCQSVNVIRTECHFGGDRRWLQCPRCDRKMGVLFLRLNLFACRRCQQVTYKTQSKDACDRAWTKQRRIEQTLGENNEKPTSMRWTTYCKKLNEISQCSLRRDLWLVGAFNRLKGY